MQRRSNLEWPSIPRKRGIARFASSRGACLKALCFTLLSACGAGPELCRTASGLRAEGEGLDCGALQTAEPKVLQVLGMRESALLHWALTATADTKFRDPQGRYEYVGGLTYCDYRYFVIGNMHSGIELTAYAHEMAHIRECETVDYNNPHSAWGTPGDPNSVWAEVERANDAIKIR